MANLRNRRTLADVARERQEEHSMYGQSGNTSITRINGENITQVSMEIVGVLTKKLSQEFSKAESRFSVLCQN